MYLKVNNYSERSHKRFCINVILNFEKKRPLMVTLKIVGRFFKNNFHNEFDKAEVSHSKSIQIDENSF